VWETVQRLLALGMDGESVLPGLAIAFTPVAAAEMKLEDHEAGAIPDYSALLRQLPLPGANEISRLIRTKVENGPLVSADDLVESLLAELDRKTPLRAEDLI
jgi:hypothetical protein